MTKSILPEDRMIPVNVSMPLRVLDLLDEQAFKIYGTAKGNRSKVIVDIVKEYLRVK